MNGIWSPDRQDTVIRPAFNLIPVRSDPTQRPTPRRLRRVADRWLPVGTSSMMARITVFRHGGHERPVITRGPKHLRFRFPSVKTRTLQLGEGKGEGYLARFNEVATCVLDYECHPCKIELIRDGRIETYRPDSIRLLIGGTIELIEAKRTPDDLGDPEYRERLATVAEVARLCGWVFRVLTLKQIMGPSADNPRQLPQRVRNVDALYGRRTMCLSRQEERVAGRVVGRGEPLDWAELRERLAPTNPLQGDAVIEALLARGLLSTDLDRPFGRCTPLMPAKPFTGPSGIRL